mgnify:CR=1 FL=1
MSSNKCGWVYAVANDSSPYIKIGMSERKDLNHRIRELGSALRSLTAIRTPYVVIKSKWVSNARRTETLIHKLLTEDSKHECNELFKVTRAYVISLFDLVEGVSEPNKDITLYEDKVGSSMSRVGGTATGSSPRTRQRGQRSKFLAFEDARSLVRKLCLKGQKGWNAYSKNDRPENIPSHPEVTYRNEGWVSSTDWLGVHTMGFPKNTRDMSGITGESKNDTRDERLERTRGRADEVEPVTTSSPLSDASPRSGIGDTVTGSSSTPRLRRQLVNPLPFEEARSFARAEKLKGQKGWNKWSKSGERPPNIPSNPARTYRGKGWDGFSDWLGY